MTPARRRITLAILGLWLMASIGLAYNALFSHSRQEDQTDPLKFPSSSIDLSAGAGEGILSADNMAPGDAVTAVMTITNSGPRDMTYAMSHRPVLSAGADLAAALVLTIKTVGTSCADFDGVTLYDGPLDAAAFGSAPNGRPLPAATAEILCLRAALPLETGDAQQSANTIVTLLFSADLMAAG
jgi:hypothetical protein